MAKKRTKYAEKYAQNMPRIFPRYGQDLLKISPTYAHDMPKYVKDTTKI